jgi:hypothetical protein
MEIPRSTWPAWTANPPSTAIKVKKAEIIFIMFTSNSSHGLVEPIIARCEKRFQPDPRLAENEIWHRICCNKMRGTGSYAAMRDGGTACLKSEENSPPMAKEVYRPRRREIPKKCTQLIF